MARKPKKLDSPELASIKSLDELELALLERNHAQRALLESQVEREFGDQRRAIDKQDAELWGRVEKRLNIDLSNYGVNQSSGELKLLEEFKKEAAA